MAVQKCPNANFVGRAVLVEYLLACGDVDPRLGAFSPVGSMRGKDLTLSSDTVDTTADDSSGGFRSNLVTFKTLEFTGDGVCRAGTTADSGQTILLDHFIEQDQPVLWMRFTYPDRTIYAYMILTEFSRSAPFDEAVTFSLTASVTATGSDTIEAVMVEKTPVAASSVAVLPATVSVAKGATTKLAATVLPAEASKVVTWTSTNPLTATVNSTGLVTGVAAGVTTVTAKQGTKVGSSTVTVTA